jgi:hypothetical protein
MQGHGACVKFVQDFGIPTMLLGGGGYTVKVCSILWARSCREIVLLSSDFPSVIPLQNVSRTWANETAIVLGEQLDENLPYNE